MPGAKSTVNSVSVNPRNSHAIRYKSGCWIERVPMWATLRASSSVARRVRVSKTVVIISNNLFSGNHLSCWVKLTWHIG